MQDTITLRRFNDLHCHFRRGQMLHEVLPFTMRYCSFGLAMPNTRPQAILCQNDVVDYKREIEGTMVKHMFSSNFQPLMTIEIRDNTTPKIVEDAYRAGAIAGKAYPLGTTTNSSEGLRDFFSPGILETFHTMECIGMPLLLHGELALERTLVTKRENVFLPILINLTERFPNLKIVLEHVSTKEGVSLVSMLDKNVAATITAHHLCTTLNNVVGDGIRPHNMCMPIPKGFDDMDALLEAATSGNPKFFLGSDTAPHARQSKECAKGACGVFSAPILPELLVEIFEKAGKLEKLEDFSSRFGASFYGLPLNSGTITLKRKEWEVPEIYGSVVPFMAGQKLQWRLA